MLVVCVFMCMLVSVCHNPVEARLEKCMCDCQVCVCVCVLTGRVAGHRALLTGELLRH